MAIPGKEIILNTNIKVNNPREEMLQQTKNVKAFVFSGHKTEKERVEEAINNSPYLKRITNANKQKIIYKRENNSLPLLKYSSSSVIQKGLRIKPRTDFERIFDVINKESPGISANKKILNLHLTKLNLIIQKESQKKAIESDLELTHSKRELFPNVKGMIINKSEKVIGKNYNISEVLKGKFNYSQRKINSEARQILSDYHVKTHFKAATEIAEKNLLNKVTFPKRHKSKKQYQIIFNEERDDQNPQENNIYELNDYKMNLNPYIHKEDYPPLREDSLKILSELMNKTEDNESDKEIEGEKLFPENNILHIEENTLVDNQAKKNVDQIEKIAKNVLNKCNVIRRKSDHNNKQIKKGEGKLMITKGLSVEEFQNKYNFNF